MLSVACYLVDGELAVLVDGHHVSAGNMCSVPRWAISQHWVDQFADHNPHGRTHECALHIASIKSIGVTVAWPSRFAGKRRRPVRMLCTRFAIHGLPRPAL
jgi:hypothetical protein